MKYRELAQRKVHHICIFGDPKTGKSTLAAKLAEEGFSLIWISTDNGHEVLDKLSTEAKERLEIVVIPDTKDFPVAITTCLKLVGGAPVRICNLHGQVECSTCRSKQRDDWTSLSLNNLDQNTVVVWDNGTQIQNSAINYIIKKECKDNQDRIDEFKPGFDEWRMLGALMARFLTNIQQASYNTVVIAHVAEAEMEDNSKKLIPLLGTLNFSRNAAGYFDHVIFAHMLNRAHRFGSRTTYQNNVITGSRSDVAIEDMLDAQKKYTPSLAPFFASILKPTQAERIAHETIHNNKAAVLASVDLASDLGSDSSTTVASPAVRALAKNLTDATMIAEPAKPTVFSGIGKIDDTSTKAQETSSTTTASDAPTSSNGGDTSASSAAKARLAMRRGLNKMSASTEEQPTVSVQKRSGVGWKLLISFQNRASATMLKQPDCV